jgi:chromosome segregation ATPase
MRRAPTALALVAGLLVAANALAADADDPTARARAALRASTQRIRELEDQNATLQAKSAEADRAKQELTAKLDADEKALADLHKQADSDKAAIDKASADLQSQRDSTAKWQASYQEAADAARTRDGDAKRLDATLTQTRERMTTCEGKNAQLYKLSEEVLDLYDKRGILDAIASDEPVTKLKRVDIENLMQDYEDKFRANKIAPPGQ